jgi:predicted nicotinamide N-methyase
VTLWTVPDAVPRRGRGSYLPSSGLLELARYSVPTSLDLEDTDSKLVRVLRFVAE